MSIPMLAKKSKEWLTSIPKDILFLFVSILAVSASFGLGIITERELGKQNNLSFTTFEDTAEPKENLSANALTATSKPATSFEERANATPPSAVYVASKNGTRYYLPTCSGAKRIKEENKVWFASKEDAEAEGLTAAANCPGL